MEQALENLIKDINSKQKTLYILCGMPYSGKTYIAEKILRYTQCKYISIDEIFAAHGYDWSRNKLPDEAAWKGIFGIASSRTRMALEDSLNVLYDSTNHTRQSRDDLRKIAGESGADAAVIYVDAPVPKVYERWEENRSGKTRPVIDKELLDTTIRAFEPPGKDEKVIIIKNQ